MFELSGITVPITADTSGLTKGLKNAVSGPGGLKSSFGGLSGVLSKVGGLLAGAGIGIAAKQMIQLGINAQETGSKFNTVFASALKEANAQVKDLTENYGLSDLASRTLLSSTGDLLSGFGFSTKAALDLSQRTAKLGADLASFSNFAGGAKGATEALTRALLGERESVKALGISIQEEDVKKQVAIDRANGLTFATERQARANATLTLAYQQSALAVGDFSRTQDSVANRIRVLQNRFEDFGVNIGTQLLPVVSQVLKALGDALPKLEKALQPFIPVIQKIGKQFAEAVEFAGNLLEILGPLFDVAGALLGVILDIAGAPIKFINDAIEAEKAFSKLVDDNKQLLDTFEDTTEEVENLDNAAKLVGEYLERAKNEGLNMEEAIQRVADGTDFSREQIEKYAYQLGLATVGAGKLLEAQRLSAVYAKQTAAWTKVFYDYYASGSVSVAQVATDIEKMDEALFGADATYESINKKLIQDKKYSEELLKIQGKQNDEQALQEKRLKRISDLEEGLAKIYADGGKATATGNIELQEELDLLRKQAAEADKKLKASENFEKSMDAALQISKAIADTIGGEVAQSLNEAIGIAESFVKVVASGGSSLQGWIGLIAGVQKAFGNFINWIQRSFDKAFNGISAFTEYAKYEFSKIRKDFAAEIGSEISGAMAASLDSDINVEELSKILGKKLLQVAVDAAVFATGYKRKIDELSKMIQAYLADGFTDSEIADIRERARAIIQETVDVVQPLRTAIIDAFNLGSENMAGQASSALAGSGAAFANGTRNFRGGMALVGEQGPELVRLPGQSSVMPAGETRELLGQSGKNIQINIYSPEAVTPSVAQDKIKQTFQELSFQGIA